MPKWYPKNIYYDVIKNENEWKLFLIIFAKFGYIPMHQKPQQTDL